MVVAGAALPPTTFIAQNWTALPTMCLLRKALHSTILPHNYPASYYLLQELREVPPFIFNVLYILQVVERDCDAQDGKKTSVDFQASPPEPWRPGNGHRGSQVCPSFPPHKKGQMSLNYFNRLQWVNYFRLQAPPS